MPLACDSWMEWASLVLQGLCLPDSHRAAVLCLCMVEATVGFSLPDTSGMLSFCFTYESSSMGLSFPDGIGTKGLCLLNSPQCL